MPPLINPEVKSKAPTDFDAPPSKYGPYQTRQIPNKTIIEQKVFQPVILDPQPNFKITEN